MTARGMGTTQPQECRRSNPPRHCTGIHRHVCLLQVHGRVCCGITHNRISIHFPVRRLLQCQYPCVRSEPLICVHAVVCVQCERPVYGEHTRADRPTDRPPPPGFFDISLSSRVSKTGPARARRVVP